MRDTIVRLRSGASVTAANESMADTSSGRSRPPMPASSVASTSRSGPLRQRRQRPGEDQREREALGRVGAVGLLEHPVLEAEQDPGVDLEGEVQVERTAAGVLGVEVDLPCLAQRVRLDEVALVVHVECVVDGVVLQVGDEAGDVDDGQRPVLLRWVGRVQACHARPGAATVAARG